MLLLRTAPILLGVTTYALFEWQWLSPLAYPWALIFVVVLYLGAVAKYVWNRNDRWIMLWNALPFAVFFLSTAVMALMLEGAFWRHALSIFVSLVMYMSLELLFLHLYHSSRYPVNGLTHLALGLIPVTNAFFAWGVVGIQAFQKPLAPPAWSVPFVFAFINALAFAVTTHPDATTHKRRVWILFAAVAGAGIGCLLLFLPLAMPAQAFLAALLIALPLRLRRYEFRPHISFSAALMEAVIAGLAFFALLLLSEWA